MTDLIPFIIENLGNGLGSGRRVTEAELPGYLAELTKWVAANSVLARPGGAGGRVGQITFPENTLLGRFGANGLAPITLSQLSQMLGLAALLGAKADVGHGHEFLGGATDIQWDTLGDGRILARENGQFVWIPTPTGGGTGGLSNPLGEDLDLGGNALVSGATELIKVQGGKVYVGGQELLPTSLGGATEGQVPRFDESAGAAGEFVSQNLRVGDVLGETPGKFIAVSDTGALEEVDAPSGGGEGIVYDGTNFFWPNLPTSDPNVANALWYNGTTITRSAGPAPGAAWSVAPTGNYSVAGTEGQQDFTPTTQDYTITNDGTEAIDWTAATEVAWVTASPASGTLNPGASVVVTATAVQTELANLSVGTATGALTFAGTGVANITRDLEADVAAATGGGNRAAVFPNDPTKYGTVSWAPTTQDYTIRVRAKFTGTDDSPVFGGDIYANLGLIKKSSKELQFWVDGAGLTTDGFALTEGPYFVLEFEKVGSTITAKKDGVATGAALTTANTVPTAAFSMRIGGMISGSTNPMEGSIDYIEFIDPADDTNTARFDFDADNFANSHPGSVVPDGTNDGAVTFEDV